MAAGRRLSAVMLTDIVGYSALSQRDETAALRLVDEHRQIVRPVLAEFEGTEIKTMGDGFLIEFPSALSAALCAIELQRRINERNQSAQGERMQLRIALHVGDVTHEGGDIFGDAVNIASRLEPLADPGGILVSGPVYDQIRGKIEGDLTQIPTPTLKNIATPVTAYRVELAWRAPALPRVTPWTDREREIDSLRPLLQDVHRGEGSLVIVQGESGVGKTRLAEELLHEAEPAGFRVLRGRSFRGEDVAYGPWAQAIRSFVQDASPGILMRACGPFSADLATLLPELADRLGPAPATSSEAPDQLRGRMLEGLAGFLVALSREAPLAILLDDFQWADVSSQRLLQRLVYDLPGHRILVLACLRESDREESPGLQRLLLDLRRSRPPTVIGLKRFSRAEFDNFVDRLVSRPTLPESPRAIVFEKSGGNPFFAEELVRRLLDDGTLRRSGDGWIFSSSTDLRLPESVRALLSERLAHLDAPTREVLRIAAFAGPTVSFDVLKHLAGMNEDELTIALERALQARVLRELPGALAGDELAFTDLQTRQVLLDEVSRIRGRQYHRKVAEAIELLDPHARDARAAELAEHFIEAHQPAKALEYLELAGDEATRVSAYADAARHYALALELAEEERVVTPRARLVEHLADAQISEGELNRGREGWQKAAELYRTAGDLRRAGEIYGRIAKTYWTYTDDESRYRDAYGKALELLRTLPPGPELARLLAFTSYVFGFWGDHSGARTVAAEGLELARQLKLPAAEALAEVGLAVIAPFPDKEGALSHIRKAVSLAPVEDLEAWFSVRGIWSVVISSLLEDPLEASRVDEETCEEVHRRRLPALEVHEHDILASRFADMGNVTKVREHLALGNAIRARLAFEEGPTSGALRSARSPGPDEIDAAVKFHLANLERYERSAPWHWGVFQTMAQLGFLALQRDDTEGALAWADRALRGLAEHGRTACLAPTYATHLLLSVRANAALGRTEFALTRLLELRAAADAAQLQLMLGCAREAEGHLARAEKRPGDSARAFQEAEELFTRRRVMSPALECRIELGVALNHSGHREEARLLWKGAFEAAATMGFDGLAARAQGLLAHADG